MDHLYENIGGKIKGLAKATFVVEALGAIIAGIVMLIEEEFLPALILLAVGPVVAWMASWILYAFGELVERLCHVDEGLNVLTQPVIAEQYRLKRKAAEEAQREAEERAKQRAAVLMKQEPEVPVKQETQAPAAAVVEAPKAVKKEKTLADKLNYALAYQTDEGMIAYLQHVEDERVASILKEPKHLTRKLVENLLQEL